MTSIFDKSSSDSIISRINNLKPDTQPLWGKMTVDQMLLHCKLATDVAFGKQDLKINFAMKILGKLLKKKVFYGGAMKKNTPTAQEFIVTERYDFEKTKKELISNFTRFASEGKSSIQLKSHPFWGKMTSEEWDILLWKHTNHHLEQFGV